MRMLDQEKHDNKIISVHIDDPEYNYNHSFNKIPEHRTLEIRNFFEHDKKLENKEVEASSVGDDKRCCGGNKKFDNSLSISFTK